MLHNNSRFSKELNLAASKRLQLQILLLINLHNNKYNLLQLYSNNNLLKHKARIKISKVLITTRFSKAILLNLIILAGKLPHLNLVNSKPHSLKLLIRTKQLGFQFKIINPSLSNKNQQRLKLKVNIILWLRKTFKASHLNRNKNTSMIYCLRFKKTKPLLKKARVFLDNQQCKCKTKKQLKKVSVSKSGTNIKSIVRAWM